MTTRMQFHMLLSDLGAAAAALDRAQTEYNTVRDKLNTLVDDLCPLPEGEPRNPMVDVQKVLNMRKISLIKLVREATLKHQEELGHERSFIGLKAAKDLVEDWIGSQYGAV